MKLEIIKVIHQVGGARRVLMDNPREAIYFRKIISYNPAMIDYIHPSIIIDIVNDKLECVKYDGVGAPPWGAIREALGMAF